MNWVDIAAIVVIVICALGGYKRGLIYSVFKLLSFVVALILAWVLYSPIAGFIRQTVVYDWLKEAISRAMNLEVVLESAAIRGMSLIDALPLPVIVQGLLHDNNNAGMYSMLRVSTIEGFVAGFFANMVIMGIAMLLVFIVVMIIMSIIGVVLDFVGELPIIRGLNSLGGLAIGAVFGIALTGLTFFLLNMFFSTGMHPLAFELLQGSWFATWIFNTLLPGILGAYT